MSKPTGSKGRGRNRNNSGKRPQGRSGNYDPNGGRNRGNAQQLLDKYLTLARDATTQGDRIAAENYFQHADHYYRVVYTRNEQQQEARQRATNNGNVSINPIPVQSVEGDQRAVDLVGEQKNSSNVMAASEVSGGEPADEVVAQTPFDSEASAQEPSPKPRRARQPRKPKESVKESPAPEAAE
jgi:hypothetical protein